MTPGLILTQYEKWIALMRWHLRLAPIEVLAFVARATRLEEVKNLTRPTCSIRRAAFETYEPAYNAVPKDTGGAIANAPLWAVLIASSARGRSQ
jgi:hypothetical protein